MRNSALQSNKDSIDSDNRFAASILIVDDHAAVRRGVKNLISSRPGWFICGEAGDGEQAVSLALQLKPSVVVMDISMPGMDGLEATRRIRESLPDTEVVIVSQHDGEQVVFEAQKAGARGYVVKSHLPADLVPAVEAALLHSSRISLPVSKAWQEAMSMAGQAARAGAKDAVSESGIEVPAERAAQPGSLLAAIVASSDDAIISKSLDGIITSWNQSAERIFGYTAEEAIGKPITLIIPLDRRKEETQILGRLRRGERIDHFHTVRRRKDGTLLDVSLTISPVRDASGRIIGASKVARDISEQIRVENALRESEERFRAIVETTAECVKLVAADGTVRHMNSSGLQMLGAGSPDDIIGKSIYDLIAPEDRDRFRAFNERVCSGEKGALEFDIVGLKGNRRQMETHAAPLRNPDGSVVQLGVTRDVTERKRSEEREARIIAEAIAANAKFRAVFEQSIVFAGIMTKEGVLVEANKSCLQVCGYPGDEVLNRPFWETKWWRDFPESQEKIRTAAQLAARGTPYREILQYSWADGTKRLVDFALYPIVDHQGQILFLHNSGVDITDLTRAEEDYRTLADNMSQLAWMADHTGWIFWYNQRWFDYTGTTLDETRGWDWQKVHRPEYVNRVVEKIKKCFQSGEVWEDTFPIRGKDGEYRWFLSRAVPIKDARGGITRWFGTHTDITELRNVEEALRKSNEFTEEQVRARTRELQVRNAEVLQQTEQVRRLSHRMLQLQDEERRRIARELHDSAGQTLTLLGINLAQLAQKAGRTAPELAADAEMIQETVQQLHREIRTTSYLLHPPMLDENGLYSALNWYVEGLVGRSDVEITLDIAKDFGRVPHEMELVVFRLVQECVTNIHRHSGSKAASIMVARNKRNVTVEVQDQGNGMSPERLAEIQSRGSGVGIRGIRERLRQFDGTLTIESGPSGTRILVTIPSPDENPGKEDGGKEPLEAAV